MKDLKQISIIGTGLLGSSLSLAILQSFSGIKTVGYSHRASTREKARKLHIADKIAETIAESVADADLVVIATPVCTFTEVFRQIKPFVKKNAVVTDIGSTKKLAHKWASQILGKEISYAGSHPIAGSEKRGVEFARDDLFENSRCIITQTAATHTSAIDLLKSFWETIGCTITIMTPSQHDRVLAAISHLPHTVAASVVSAVSGNMINFAGKGFIDTTRVASGPANVWADILVTNAQNTSKSIDRVIAELTKLKIALDEQDRKKIEKFLEKAASKRNDLIQYKMKKHELI